MNKQLIELHAEIAKTINDNDIGATKNLLDEVFCMSVPAKEYDRFRLSNEHLGGTSPYYGTTYTKKDQK